MNTLKATSIYIFSAAAVFAQEASTSAPAAEQAAPSPAIKYEKDDYRNYFGAGWQADSGEVISFAKRMGFSHVMAMGGNA